MKLNPQKYFYILLIIVISFVFSNECKSQQKSKQQSNKHTISGYVKDASTGEYLIGANVYIKETLKGTTTNRYGFFSLTHDEGEYHFVVSFIGYTNYDKIINLNKNYQINVSLKLNAILTKEVVITGEKEDKNTQNTKVGTFELPIEKVKALPAFMGEVDVLKTIQLAPGVQSAGEGNTGFYIRGGGPDQNLILLDEAVVYNASHLFGFFSVFNADALKNVELTKAGMPANYGGRLASVLDISMKEGNNKKYKVNGGIGLIASRLTIEGPIKKDTCSFIISGRRTYVDIIMKPFMDESSSFSGSGYYFYDLNTKINYIFSDKDRVFLSGYFGRDVFTIKSAESSFDNSISWGNATVSFRWNHLYNDKLFSNTSIIYNDYQFNSSSFQNQYEMELNSGIRDWNAKIDYTYLLSTKHNVKFGVNYIYHTFTPNNATSQVSDVDLDLGEAVKLYSHDAAAYISDDFELTERIKFNVGLRYTYFQQIGPFDRFIKNERGETIDTIHYDKNENVKTYNHLEPRFSLRFKVNELSSIKLSYTQNYQYIHLASVSSVSLPTDIWVPSSSLVKPQFGTQYSLGYYRNFKQNIYESYIEIYYKELKNQIEYKEGALPEDNINNNTDNNFTFGEGESYGVELFFKKRKGKITGWIGYTLSWTTRKFPEINQGKEFFAKYDRRHDVSIVISYDINKRLSCSAIWVYATGNAMTLPISRYVIEGNIINEYSEKNSFRMPAYHRMDLSLTYQLKKRKKYESNINLSIYNVYNRYNPYYIYFETTGNINDYDLEIQAKQVSLFPIIPSISWNFKF